MSDKVEDGGPAFPSGHIDVGADKVESAIHDGMTLRDYFAGQAMTKKAWPTEFVGKKETAEAYSEYARRAYKIADAMLSARKGARDE
jgi:hypothetical protein